MVGQKRKSVCLMALVYALHCVAMTCTGLQSGSMVGCIGPSATGDTTLNLKMVKCFIVPEKGRFSVASSTVLISIYSIMVFAILKNLRLITTATCLPATTIQMQATKQGLCTVLRVARRGGVWSTKRLKVKTNEGHGFKKMVGIRMLPSGPPGFCQPLIRLLPAHQDSRTIREVVSMIATKTTSSFATLGAALRTLESCLLR